MQMLVSLFPPQQAPVRSSQSIGNRSEGSSSFQQLLSRRQPKDRAPDPGQDSAFPSQSPVSAEDAAPDLVQQDLAAMMIAQGIAPLPTDPLAPSAVSPVATDALTLASASPTTLQQSAMTESALPAQSPAQNGEGSALQTATDNLIRSGLRPQSLTQSSPTQAQTSAQGQNLIKGTSTQPSTAQAQQELDGEIRTLSDATAKPLFQQMEHTPVKVGETPVANAEAPHFEEALAKPIQKALGEGAQTVEIKLAPAHLGSVTVSLTQNQDGTLQVVLLTMTDKTARLLSEHSGGLMQLLRAGPHSSVQIEIQQSDQGQQQGQENRQNQGQRDPQQERRQQEQQHGSDNFLQQLRLGLLPLAAETV